MRVLLGEFREPANKPPLRGLRTYFATDCAVGNRALRAMGLVEQRVSRVRKILQQARADVHIRKLRGAGYVLKPTIEIARTEPAFAAPLLPLLPDKIGAFA